jgi:hypothetical protein
MRFEYSYVPDSSLDGSALNPCHYCGQPANAVDHVIPRVLIARLRVLEDEETTRQMYLRHRVRTVPCCRECNSIINSHYFSTLDERKAFLKTRLRKRYKRLLEMPEWTVDEMTELDGQLQDYVIQGTRMKRLIQKRIAW